VFQLHGQRSTALLAGAVDTHGEASEQILAREKLRNNRALFEAIDRLYVSRGEELPGGWGLKRGARSKNKPGTMRRLGKVLRQFDLTYDLYGMSGPQIYDLLPKEFNKFKNL
jgi:hypothetical protein